MSTARGISVLIAQSDDVAREELVSILSAAEDSGSKPTYYTTTPILPDYLANAGHMQHNPFREP